MRRYLSAAWAVACGSLAYAATRMLTVGAAPGLATNILNVLRGGAAGTTFTAIAHLYVQVHVGDPGAAGTANTSAVTTRSEATFTASSGGSALALSNTPSWSMTATETISHISVWDATTAGNFQYSVALSSSKAVANGDTLNLTSLGVSVTPQAA